MVILLEVKNKLLKTNKYKRKTELDSQVIMRVQYVLIDCALVDGGRRWCDAAQFFFHRGE
jgi:hypothetical protein